MYACMHACIYACIYACVHACMHVCTYACMCVCVYVCMVTCSVHQVDEQGVPNEKPRNNIRPIENLWIEQSVRISLVILTARELRLPSSGTYQLYCKAQMIGGDDPKDCSDAMQEVVVEQGQLGAANFYWPCMMFTRIPKGSMLRLYM